MDIARAILIHGGGGETPPQLLWALSLGKLVVSQVFTLKGAHFTSTASRSTEVPSVVCEVVIRCFLGGSFS